MKDRRPGRKPRVAKAAGGQRTRFLGYFLDRGLAQLVRLADATPLGPGREFGSVEVDHDLNEDIEPIARKALGRVRKRAVSPPPGDGGAGLDAGGWRIEFFLLTEKYNARRLSEGYRQLFQTLQGAVRDRSDPEPEVAESIVPEGGRPPDCECVIRARWMPPARERKPGLKDATQRYRLESMPGRDAREHKGEKGKEPAGASAERRAEELRTSALPEGSLLTVSQAAELLGLDPSAVRWHCRKGNLQATKAGPRAWLITPAAAEQFRKDHLESRERPGPKRQVT